MCTSQYSPMASPSRRQLLQRTAAIGAGALFGTALSTLLPSEAAAMPLSPDVYRDPAAALAALYDGNSRFVKGEVMAPNRNMARLKEVAAGQKPFAAFLGCADSRVPVEIVFDQGFGDVFVTRIAGNVADPAIIGSLEFGTEVLGAQVLYVLGHTKCGAVHATLEGKPLPGSIPMIAKAIQPAVADLLKNKKDATVNDLMNAAVEANVRYQMKQVMGSSEMLRKAQADGKLTLLMAIYDVDTGAVRFLD